jgi:hypothetical protein
MKQSVINKVNQCKKCLSYYTEGVEGDDGVCDACFDADVDPVVDEDEVIEEADPPDINIQND